MTLVLIFSILIPSGVLMLLYVFMTSKPTPAEDADEDILEEASEDSENFQNHREAANAASEEATVLGSLPAGQRKRL